ncbi:MAG TPA: DUF2784 domain-containing protein [Rhodocyclaceae bacterium]
MADRLRTLDWLRWGLLLPAALVGWYAALVAGMLLLALAERLCPAEAMVSGACVAPWFDSVSTAVFCFSTGLAAALIVLLPTLVAPRARPHVAWVVFGLGSVAAVLMGVTASAYAEMASAVVAGALMAIWLSRRDSAGSEGFFLGGSHVLALHFLFVLFAVFGGLLVLVDLRWACLHLPAVAWSSIVNLAGWTCPLTPLEKELRARDGQAAYDGGFIEHYLGPLVYPLGMPRRMELVAGISIVVWNVIVYGAIWALA